MKHRNKVNTKLVMTLSALLLAATGIVLTFFPTEISVYLGIGDTNVSNIIFQLLGAMYFAFAMLNWMAKGSYIGGIYNRPIAIANFTHFLMGGLALLKDVTKNPDSQYAIWIVAILYSLFAIVFALILFQSPGSPGKAST